MTESSTASEPTPLVMLPGLLCNAELFRPQINHFQASRDIVIPNLSNADSMEGLAAEVLNSAPPTFALAGLSMGGIVSFEILRQAPHRVERLALLDTAPEAEHDKHREARQQHIKAVQEGGLEYLEWLIMTNFFPRYVAESRLADNILQQCVKDMLRDIGVDGFLFQSRALMHRKDSWQTIDSISVPTLVLCGDEDVMCKPKVHQAMAERIEGAELTIVPKCGHLSTLEKPDNVIRSMERWLEA